MRDYDHRTFLGLAAINLSARSTAPSKWRTTGFSFPSGEHEIGWFCLHQDAAFLLSSIIFDPCAAHAGAGGARSWAISDRISANICRDTATSASWNVT